MSENPAHPSAPAHHPDANMIETLQSLIVAFVLAMTFRGFVVEGFVIPTGSMAPTLMGAHTRMQSQETGWSIAAGLDRGSVATIDNVIDPMLGPGFSGSAIASKVPAARMGDRILVLKCLYPFFEPHRFDVVVFKNPTKSQGDEANYIKRLVGLPNEELWFCDGDVFARPDKSGGDAGAAEFAVQRKPEHVQRAVWQPVYDSDFVPVNVERLNEESRRHWNGPPWTGDQSFWDLSGRAYRCNSSGPAELGWDAGRRGIDDWTAYNMLIGAQYQFQTVPVSDVRVRATIVPDAAGLVSELELRARSHAFEFIVEPGKAIMRMRPTSDQNEQVVEHSAAIDLPGPGESFTVECWHVDQSMRMFINGREAVEPIVYDWTPVQRLQNATGVFNTTDALALLNRNVIAPRLRWKFSGSPLTMHRVRVDRDLFYRRDVLRAPSRDQTDNPTRPEFENIVRPGKPAYGTSPENMAHIGADQFMMCGDNSQSSFDSRLWRNPDPLVASQIDPTPFVVNRKLLLGKAWVVYFPAPLPMSEGGRQVIPDFGRLRFIR